MINNETQVRLTIELEGRLSAKASNSNSKKERHLAAILDRKGKRFHNEYTAPTVQSASQCTTLSSECVQHFISDEGKPIHMAPSEWKKKNAKQRLETNLQLQADYISGHKNTTYSYALLD